MKKPPYTEDYTQLAKDVYEIAMWKGYKFRKGRNLDSWLKLGWQTLFKRELSQKDINNLKKFLARKEELDQKVIRGKLLNKELINQPERNIRKNYIGADGYIYMTKVIPSCPITEDARNRREEKVKILEEENIQKRKKRFEEYEERFLKEQARKLWFSNNYYYKEGKIYKR